jgi:hypothetical protein
LTFQFGSENSASENLCRPPSASEKARTAIGHQLGFAGARVTGITGDSLPADIVRRAVASTTDESLAHTESMRI